MSARSALVAALFSFSASAQSQLDFTRQDISIDISGPNPVIDLDLTLTAKANNQSVFDFLIPPANVAAFDVDGASVVPAAHPQYPQYMKRVRLPAALSLGQSARLHARLEGPMQCPATPTQACFSTPERTILLPANYEAAWYFVNMYESTDTFESTITVRAPEDRTVLAGHGPGSSMSLGDGTTRWTYSLATPLDQLFTVAEKLDVFEATGAYTVKVFTKPGFEGIANAQKAARLGAQLLPVYGGWFGDLPVREAHLVSVPPSFPAAGMGLLGNVMLGEYVFTSYDYLLEQGTAHELAHSWWGGLTRGADDEQAFLAEAFAEYSAWRALGVIQGDAVRTAGVRMNSVWYMYRTPPGQDVAPLSVDVTRQPGFVYVTYHKGSSVLRTLEEAAGSTAFTAALAKLAKMPPGTETVDALSAEVRAAGGPDLAPLVTQWLYNTGFPKLTVTAVPAGEGIRWTVDCVGPCYLQLPVRATLPSGKVVEKTLDVVPGRSVLELPFQDAVETIEADPRWTVVREVTGKVAADVTLDGVVDGRDLLEAAVRVGTALPTQRRVDGHYDPLYDVDRDYDVDIADLATIATAP